MDFLEYDIKDSGAFAPFISTMEGTGADIDGSRVMFESGNSAAKMLADTLVEYDIMTPVMEAGQAPAREQPAVNNQRKQQAKQASKPSAQKPAGANQQKQQAKQASNPSAQKPAGADKAQGAKAGSADGVVATEPHAPEKKVPTKKGAKRMDDPNRKEILDEISKKLAELGIEDLEASPVQIRAAKYIDGEAKKAKENWPEVYAKFASNPMGIGKLVFDVIQKTDPELYEELKEKGVLNEKGQNTVSVAQKSELAEAMKKILGQVEVPDAFNVEVDDSEWENALITSCGYPMINLTSPLVRDMLRAPDPSQQKRAYKAFKKQLGADPDVAKALAIGIKGNLGVGGKQKKPKTDMNAKIGKTESVGTEGEVLVEGPLSAIKNVFLNPVEVLRGIAQNKGTACHRNNLVVMYDDIVGKSGEGNDLVKVVPLGVSSGVLVDLNQSVQVPMSHLAAFYSVVDPKVSFKSYAKAMAEVNKKNENAHASMEGKARMLGKKILSNVPLLGKGAKADLAAQDNSELMSAMGELAEYIQSNGHPPFYLLKPKSNPKEVDHWSDEKAANGYQMIIMNQNGHKAGIILKKDVAEALFKVG